MLPSAEPTPQPIRSHSLLSLLIAGVGVIVVVAGILYLVSSGLVPRSSEACTSIYTDSLLPSAKQNSDEFFAGHPKLQPRDASLYLFYSPALQKCIAANFIEIQSDSPVDPKQYPGAYIQTLSASTIFIYFYNAQNGLLRWESLYPSTAVDFIPLFDDFLASLDEKGSVYAFGSDGTEPVPQTDEACRAAYGSTVAAAAENLSQDGSAVQQALFHSTALKYCVGVIIAVKGNTTNVYTFDASTGDMLDASDNSIVIEEYASRSDAGTATPRADTR